MNKEDINNAKSGTKYIESSGKSWFRRFVVLASVIAFGAVMLGLGYRIGLHPSAASKNVGGDQTQKGHIRYWTCSMHPQIKSSNEGKCPICFMDLIPVYETSKDGRTEETRLVLSDTARKLAEIETTAVEYRPLSVIVRMVGKIEYDETRLAYLSAWVPGRIDRLYVNYVGVRVRKGEHLIYLYSPELRTAQEEFLIASRHLRSVRQMGDPNDVLSSLNVKEATQKKLELWGILPTQIEELEKTGRSDDHMTIFAPIGGTVIARDAYEGKYVEAGERLFTIADISNVWAKLDAYEIDLKWLRYGEIAEFETDAYPGEVFKGQIAFIQPFVNEMTRTVKIRANIVNQDERLIPGMFVRAKVQVTLNEAGRVKEPNLAGKWMCSMHPEVVKDNQGTCDICQMNLVEALSLGFGRPDVPAKRVLSIPASAPLLTGTRAVVFVEQREGEEVSYTAREVQLGPLAGDYYAVLSGLEEGDRVVTRGNFKIDASLQIQAKPSMMKLGNSTESPAHENSDSSEQRDRLGDKR